MSQINIKNEMEMLEGNLTRIMVTDDMKELLNAYKWATMRIDTIVSERAKELATRNLVRCNDETDRR